MLRSYTVVVYLVEYHCVVYISIVIAWFYAVYTIFIRVLYHCRHVFSWRSCGVWDKCFLIFLNLIWKIKKTNLFITIIYLHETYTSGWKVSSIHNTHVHIQMYMYWFIIIPFARFLLTTKQQPQKFPRSSAVACVSLLSSEKPKHNYFAILNLGLFFT